MKRETIVCDKCGHSCYRDAPCGECGHQTYGPPAERRDLSRCQTCGGNGEIESYHNGDLSRCPACRGNGFAPQGGSLRR